MIEVVTTTTTVTEHRHETDCAGAIAEAVRLATNVNPQDPPEDKSWARIAAYEIAEGIETGIDQLEDDDRLAFWLKLEDAIGTMRCLVEPVD